MLCKCGAVSGVCVDAVYVSVAFSVVGVVRYFKGWVLVKLLLLLFLIMSA